MKNVLFIYFITLCTVSFGEDSLSGLDQELKDLKSENKYLKKTLTTIKKVEKLKSENERLKLEVSCNQERDYVACNDLGVHYYQMKRFGKASYVWDKACSNLNFESCYYLGRFHDKKRRIKQAVNFYKKSCDGDYFIACNNLGVIYANKKQIDFSINYFKQACENDYKASCVNLGKLHLSKGNEVDSIYWFQNACDNGIGSACKLVENVMIKHKEKCQGGFVAACITIGNLYRKINEYEKAEDSFAIGCRKLSAVACFNQGLMTYEMEEEDDSIRAWDKSCGLKDDYSCLLSSSLKKDKQILKKLHKYYYRLCEKGDGESCYWLSVSFSLKKDIKTAISYIKKASNFGFIAWSASKKNILLKNIRNLNDYRELQKRVSVN